MDSKFYKGVSLLSGGFTGVYGIDLVLPNTEIIGSLGSTPSTLLGVGLVLVAASTLQTGARSLINRE